MVEIPTSAPLFTVLLTFACEPAERPALVDKLHAWVRERMAPFDGFVSGLLYVNEEGDGIVELFQWRDRESYEIYRASEVGHEASEWLVGYHPRVKYLEVARFVDAGL